GAQVIAAAGDRQQGADGLAHPVDQADDLLEVFGGRALGCLHQGQLGLATDAGQGGAELVGELGGEPLLAAQGTGDPVQQGVEGAPQVGDLVAGAGVVEPCVQGSFAPVVGE